MITFSYKLTTYTHYLHQLATRLDATVHDDQFQVPERHGSGFYRVIRLNGGPEALLYEFRLKDTLVLNRERNHSEYYTLVLEEMPGERKYRMMVDADELTMRADRSSIFYLSSFLYDVETVLYPDQTLRGIRILLTPEWMQQYLMLSEKQSVLEEYISLKAAGVWYKPATAELTALLHELLHLQKGPLLFYQSKIFRIIELFFEWLYNEMKMLVGKSGINRHDVEAAQKIEARLTADVTQLPPTLKELAREAAISESKLKKIFKSVYGLPPYEYFQRQRMQKARLMLLSGDYSVKDIGYTLGYANLSNFTLAFKKVFGQLPSQLLSK